jgi:hypothetical protein
MGIVTLSESTMLTVLIALILLAAAVGAIYLLLKNMGEEGIEVAAPGSCKSGRCGVRCAPVTSNDHKENALDEANEDKLKDAA